VAVALVHALEVVLVLPAGDLPAERRALLVSGPEMDPAPHASVDDLLEHLRETLEVPRLAGEARLTMSNSAFQLGSARVARLPSESAPWIASIGRQKFQ
jgi:hypothetical protein